jgi:arabinan endo-1,5-alpha-L-arabinosidase
MYGTDASYGNAAEGHGHFQGKRSSDLVNWDWVGGPFYEAPSWVADSLNAIRSRMGLASISEDNIRYLYGRQQYAGLMSEDRRPCVCTIA